jgi:hypothetical protein
VANQKVKRSLGMSPEAAYLWKNLTSAPSALSPSCLPNALPNGGCVRLCPSRYQPLFSPGTADRQGGRGP